MAEFLAFGDERQKSLVPDKGLHVHQFKEAELALFIIEKQIDIGMVSRVVARRRAEDEKMLHAKPLQIGFVAPQKADGFGSIHKNSMG